MMNSTEWPRWFLRRMTAWCAKELRLPMGDVALAVFRNSRSAWGGCARSWRKQISVCVGHAGCFPTAGYKHGNGHQNTIQDRIEALVWVTAHELAHLMQHRERTRTRQMGGHGGSEIATEWHAKPVLEKFRQMRDALLAEWGQEPATCLRAKSPVPITEKRALKAQTNLDRWQRKLRLAQTKVRKLKARVAYYARKP